MTPLPRRALLLAAPALALTACTGRSKSEPTPTPTSTSPSASSESADPSDSGASTPAEASDAGSASDGGDDDERVDEPMPSKADKSATKAATKAATATMKVWVKGSTMDEQDWRKKLNATLTPSGQQVAQRTWGYRVTDTKLVGAPEVVRANEESAVLHVRTNKNTYEVTVVRSGDTWLTSNLTTVERK